MNAATNKTIVRILRPLVRFLIRNGVLFHHFVDLVKWVYVDVAFESKLDGRKLSKSRVSVLTGLSRVEVAKQADRSIEDTEDGTKWHRAGRVLSAWATEPEYLDEAGNPREIPVNGEPQCFEDLVTRHSGGATVRSVLDEMVRVEAVAQDEGTLTLLRPYFLVDESENRAMQMEILGWSAGSLLDTLEHNTRENQTELRFQRLVFEENIPLDRLPEIRRQLRSSGQHWADQTDGFLTGVKSASAGQPGSGPGAHAGMGIYYFERPASDLVHTTEDKT